MRLVGMPHGRARSAADGRADRTGDHGSRNGTGRGSLFSRMAACGKCESADGQDSE